MRNLFGMVCLLSLSLGTGCGAAVDTEASEDEELGTSQQDLWTSRGVTLWPGGVLRVCFHEGIWNDASLATWRRNVKTWVQTQIEPFGDLQFTDFTACPADLGNEWVELRTWDRDHSNSGVGQVSAENRIRFGRDMQSRAVVVHEFMHRLGFKHEWEREGGSECESGSPETTTGTQWTPYDHDSITNSTYCNSENVLSAFDRAGVSAAYGRHPQAFNASSVTWSDGALVSTAWTSVSSKRDPSSFVDVSLTSDDILVGNFRHDPLELRPADDFLASTSLNWYISNKGYEPFVSASVNKTPVRELLVGDFDGDGTDDLLHANGTFWNICYGAKTGWTKLGANTVPKSELLIGDFDADGHDDVLRVSGGKWYLSSEGTGEPVQIKTSGAVFADLKVGEFDGLPGDDILYGDGNSWRYTSSAKSPWRTLSASTVRGRDLLIGNFDGEGTDDVFTIVDGTKWLSRDARGEPENIGSTGIALSSMRVANFGLKQDSIFRP